MATTLHVRLHGNEVPVKVGPGTVLDQVRQAVCKKFSVEAAAYSFVHEGRVVDAALSFEAAGLPAGGAVVVTLQRGAGGGGSTSASAKKKKKRVVRIGLQVVEMPGRVSGEFTPNTTLWAILEALESEPGALTRRFQPALVEKRGKFGRKEMVREGAVQYAQPVLVYMRREVAGLAELCTTTLRKLGIKSGNALLHVRFVAADKTIEQVNAEVAAATTAAGAPADTPAAGESASELAARVEAEERARTAKDAEARAWLEAEAERSAQAERERVQAQAAQEAAQAERDRAAAARTEATLTSGTTPMDVGSASGTTPMDVGSASGAAPVDVGSASGAAPVDVGSASGAAPVDMGSASTSASAPPVPMDVGGAADDAALERRDLKVLRAVAESAVQDGTGDDGDDDEDFYRITPSDLAAMQSGLSSRVASDAPLMTRKMREAEEAKKQKRYKSVLIRVRFPNAVMVQGTFRPTEKIGALYAFVDSLLLPAAQQSGYYLYVAPPVKRLTDRAATLFAEGLVPAAVVNFGGTSLAAPELLQPRFLDQLSAFERAQLPRPADATATADAESGWVDVGAGGSSSRAPASGAGAKKKKGGMPKWLKLGK